MFNYQEIVSLIRQQYELLPSIIRRLRFGKAAQLQLLRSLEILTRSLSLSAAIKHLIGSTQGVKLDVLLDMQNRTRRGQSALSAAYDWFTPEIAAALSLNEGVNSNNGFRISIEILSSADSNVFKPFRILLYPLLLLSLALGINKFIYTAMLSPYRHLIIGDDTLPPEFAKVIHTADFIGLPLLFSLIGALVFGIAFMIFLGSYVGENRKSLDRYPLFSAYRSIAAIGFLRMYANLLMLNLPNLKVLEQIDSTSRNTYLKAHIKQMASVVAAGGSIGSAIDTGLIDSIDVSTIKVLSSSKGTGYREAILSSLDLSLDRLSFTLKKYALSISFVIGLLAISLALNGVLVALSSDLLFQLH